MSLATYAAFLREQHLADVSDENQRVLRELDVPLLRLFAHLDPLEMQSLSRASMERFLKDFEDGRALEAAAESLRQWEADELPGVPKHSIGPSDLVLIYAAQKSALLAFVPHFTTSVYEAVALVGEMEAHFRVVQDGAFKVYAKLSQDSARQAAALRASQDFAEELQAANEALQSQASEMAQQREALQTLFEQLRDHTGQVEAEVARRTQSLRERETQLTSAQRLAHVGSWEYDLLEDRVTWSDELFRIHGYEPQAFEVTYEAVQLHTFPDDAALMRQAVANALATGEGYQLEYRILRPDGTLIHASGRAEVVLDSQGKPRKLLGVSMDISRYHESQEALAQQAMALAEANQQLLQADRYKDEFLAVISHELRTPLNFIMAFASVLEDGVAGDLTAEQQQYVVKILSGADRLLVLIRDLLDFAALSAGTLSMFPTQTGLAAIIAEGVGLVQELANQKGVKLEQDVELTEAVEVDGDRIVQVVVNLVGNAIKFTPSGGSVRVRLTRTDGFAVLAVSDTGIGIAQDQLPRLFKQFTQLDMGPTRGAGGVGLGLAIVKRLVEAHGGSVEVESTLGVGSTFCVRLPLVAAAASLNR